MGTFVRRRATVAGNGRRRPPGYAPGMSTSGHRLPAVIGDAAGVQLRRWTPQDAQTLDELVLASLNHLCPWMAWAKDEPLGLAQRRVMLQQREAEWLAGGDPMMGIFCRGVAVGGGGLHRRIDPRGLEIGYWVHPQHTRQGIATQAARLLADAAFSLSDVTHVEIHHDKANEASAGVPRKLGFTLIDERPDAPTAPGEVGVEMRWRMLRGDWSS